MDDSGVRPLRRISSASAILDAARSVGAAQGISAITARAVAGKAGVSASAINYQFGGLAALLAELGQALAAEHLAEIASLLEHAAQAPPHLRSAPGFVAATVTHLTHAKRAQTLLELELQLNQRGPDPAHVARAEQISARLAQGFEIEPEAAARWTLFIDGAVQLALLDRCPVSAASWVARAAFRFAARQGSFDIEGTANGADEPPAPLIADGPAHPRALEIIDAAIRLLSRGVELTHRRIAEEAKLPLAATTYHFASKDEIVTAAYQATYGRLPQDRRSSSGFSIPFSEEGDLKEAHLLLERLLLASARDEALRAVAEQIRNSRGRNSAATLRRWGAASADRLDGLVWAILYNGCFRMTRARPAHERSAFFRRGMIDLTCALFPGLERDRLVQAMMTSGQPASSPGLA